MLSPGELINQAIELREIIRAEERITNQKKKELEALEAQIFDKLNELDVTSLSGSRGTAFKTTLDVVNVDDWEEVWNYARDHDAPYFFQRRIASRAVLDALESGDDIPGVSRSTITKLGLRAS